MTIAETSTSAGTDLVDELQAWLEENWDPDLTVGEWWKRLGTGRLGRADRSPPTPTAGACPGATPCVVRRRSPRFGALGAPIGHVDRLWPPPTIATHGTREQIDRLIPPA